MSKKESTFLNMTITLFAITIIAGVSLGFINDITEQPIKDAKITKKTNALKLVLPDFNNKIVLVTGGTGSFGKYFTKYLLKNYNVKKILIYLDS